MTSLNAQKVGLKDRGVLREGAYADVTVFNPKTVIDRSKYTDQFSQLQPALMFVASRPTVIHSAPQANAVVGALVIAAFVIALCTVLIVLWWFGWSDRVARAARASEPQAPPDFSKLAE